MVWSTRVALFLWLVGLTSVGCRGNTAPERVVTQWLEALEQGDKKLAWALLSQESQRIWQKQASAVGLSSGQALFLKGRMGMRRQLRLDKGRLPVIKGDKATLYYKDALDRPVVLSLRREKQKWLIHLEGHFLRAPTPSTPARPQVPSPARVTKRQDSPRQRGAITPASRPATSRPKGPK